MPDFNILRESKVDKSFRVASILGKYDIKSSHIKENFKGNLNIESLDNWNIGLIVGASGTGKSTIAKEIFKDNYIREFNYKSSSILDDMPENVSTNEICQKFISVGFSSVPSWIKPYHVLSDGEKMRVNLARSLLAGNETIVFDEFTSVVDRNIAKIASFAISKCIKRENKKFIAVSCHYDVIDWLCPDWIFDTNKMEFVKKKSPDQKLNLKFMNAREFFGKFLKSIII